MRFLSWLFGKPARALPERVDLPVASGGGNAVDLLDAAEGVVFDLWRKSGQLVRQAMLWDAQNQVSMFSFPSAVSRDETLEELRNAVGESAYERVVFFSESSAFAPSGEKVDVISIEVGDGRGNAYGQRINSADPEPKQLAQNLATLSRSPFAGLLVD